MFQLVKKQEDVAVIRDLKTGEVIELVHTIETYQDENGGLWEKTTTPALIADGGLITRVDDVGPTCRYCSTRLSNRSVVTCVRCSKRICAFHSAQLNGQIICTRCRTFLFSVGAVRLAGRLLSGTAKGARWLLEDHRDRR